ncbi:MAG: NfeD family protein [Thermoguttaceae bacterium]
MNPILWMLMFLSIAFLCAVLEVFIPSAGVLTALAFMALITSVVFAFLHDSYLGFTYFTFISSAIPFLFWGLTSLWSRTPIGRRILLDPKDDPALKPSETFLEMKSLIGHKGITRSSMFLCGLIEIEGKHYNAISESEPLEPNTPVIVVEVDGVQLLVRRIIDEKNAESKSESEHNSFPTTVSDPFETKCL